MDKAEQIFNEFPIVETDRLILRQLRMDDYLDIYEIYSDEEVIKYNGIDVITQVSEAIEYTKKIIEGYNEGYFFRWVIELKSENRVIGTIGLHHIESWNHKLEIGYIINKNYWRKGFCYEALKAVITYVFDILNVVRIEASIHRDNVPSQKLVEKLGFQLEGIKRKAAFNYRTKEFEDREFFSVLSTKYFGEDN